MSNIIRVIKIHWFRKKRENTCWAVSRRTRAMKLCVCVQREVIFTLHRESDHVAPTSFSHFSFRRRFCRLVRLFECNTTCWCVVGQTMNETTNQISSKWCCLSANNYRNCMHGHSRNEETGKKIKSLKMQKRQNIIVVRSTNWFLACFFSLSAPNANVHAFNALVCVCAKSRLRMPVETMKWISNLRAAIFFFSSIIHTAATGTNLIVHIARRVKQKTRCVVGSHSFRFYFQADGEQTIRSNIHLVHVLGVAAPFVRLLVRWNEPFFVFSHLIFNSSFLFIFLFVGRLAWKLKRWMWTGCPVNLIWFFWIYSRKLALNWFSCFLYVIIFISLLCCCFSHCIFREWKKNVVEVRIEICKHSTNYNSDLDWSE